MDSEKHRPSPALRGKRDGAHPTPSLVDAACGVFVAPVVQEPQVVREADEKPELLQTEVGTSEMASTMTGIGRFHETFKHIECCALDAVTEQESLAARETLQGRYQPEDEAVVGLQRRTGSSGSVRCAATTALIRLVRLQIPLAVVVSLQNTRKNPPRGASPPWNPPQEVKA